MYGGRNVSVVVCLQLYFKWKKGIMKSRNKGDNNFNKIRSCIEIFSLFLVFMNKKDGLGIFK